MKKIIITLLVLICLVCFYSRDIQHWAQERRAIRTVMWFEGATNVINPKAYRQDDGSIRVEFDSPLIGKGDYNHSFGIAVVKNGKIEGGRAMYSGR